MSFILDSQNNISIIISPLRERQREGVSLQSIRYYFANPINPHLTSPFEKERE
jgi:hypothetical protein